MHTTGTPGQFLPPRTPKIGQNLNKNHFDVIMFVPVVCTYSKSLKTSNTHSNLSKNTLRVAISCLDVIYVPICTGDKIKFTAFCSRKSKFFDIFSFFWRKNAVN